MKLIFRILFVIQILFFCSNFTKVYSQSEKIKENQKAQKKANKYFDESEFDAALPLYEKIIIENYLNDIKFLQSYFNYSEIMAKRKNFNEAVEKCGKALQLIEERIIELETQEEKKTKEKKEIATLKEQKGLSEQYLNNYRKLRANHNTNQEQIYDERTFSRSNYNFTEKDFVTDLFGLPFESDQAKKIKIKEIIEKEHDKKSNENNLYNKTFSEITALNSYWAKFVKRNQFEWHDELTEKDTWYRDRIESYNGILNEIDSVERVKEIIEKELNFIDKKIKIYEEKISNIKNIRDVTILNELESKLYTMPQSLVVIGRKELQDDQKKEEEVNKLYNALVEGAISEVSCIEILQRLNIYDDNINSLYSIEIKGIAQTTDKYYNTPTKLLKNAEHKKAAHIIDIYRIEVFPFEEPKSNKSKNKNNEKTKNNSNNDSNVDVFIYDSNSDRLKRISDGHEFSLNNKEMFKFNNDEKDFIRELEKHSIEFNYIYEDKIKEAVSSYKESYNKINNKISKNENILYISKLDKRDKEKELVNIQNQIKTIEESDLLKHKKACKEAKNNYENYYENKSQYINHIVVRDIDYLGVSVPNGFKKLADICFDNISETIKKQYNKSTVYKEVSDYTQDITLQKEKIEFDLIIDSVRIISLDVYQTGDKNYLALNLAFKIRWESLGAEKPDLTLDNLITKEIEKTPESQRVLDKSIKESGQISNITPTEKQVEKEKPHKNNSETKHNISTETTKPKPKFNFKWKVYKKMSLRYYNLLENKQDGWRLPTINELNKIFDDPKCRNEINRSLKIKNWTNQTKKTVFISNEKKYDSETNKELYKCFLVKDGNYSREIIKKDDGEMVWIILIEE